MFLIIFEIKPTCKITTAEYITKYNIYFSFQSCQLYTSALMDSSGIDYHVVLCQNALQQCLTYPELQAELFCGLIKQTSKHLQAKPGVQVTKTLNKIKHSRVSVAFFIAYLDK